MPRMQTISIRVPDEELQWLVSLDEGNTRTPSEKLRLLVARARQQQIGMADPETCTTWMRTLAQPFADSLAALERQKKIQSELIAAVEEWVPAMMATLISSRIGGHKAQESALEVEAILAQQCFRLITAVLRAAVTTNPATYDKSVLDRYLADIVEIANIISTKRGAA